MPDIIITPSAGKLEFVDNSAQNIRRHAFTLDHNDGIKLDAPLSAAAVIAPLNVINVTVNNSNVNYPFVLASGSAETGTKTLMMDGSGGTYNPFTNTATIDISGNSATTTLASDSTNLGGVSAASYVTLTGTQTLTNKTITGTFTGNLTGTGSWATNAVNANTATNSTQLNGQAASYYQTALNGTGFVKISGTTISYDNSTYTPTSRTITAGTGISGGGDLSANRTIAVDDTVSRKYTSTINNVTSSAWTTVCNVVGDNLSSAIRATFNGTSNSVVVNVLADILVNHFQDIIVYAISGFYSKLTIRIITNNDASFTLQVKHDGGTSTNLAVEIFPLNTETITFNPGTLFSTTTFDHICEWGVSTSGNGGNNSDIRTAGIFYGAGTGLTGTATNLTAGTATNSTQLNGQAASYYTNIPARLGYTPVNQAGDTISGNLIINGNFTVNGATTLFSASNVYISSSQLYIEDNILTLNAFSPYLRYAGVEMYDSGSGTLSSLLWDGEADYFFLTGSSVNGKIITGPDGQTNLSSNYVPKATAGYKLGNSLIYDNGTNIGIGITTPVYKTEIYSGVKTSAFTGLSISNFNNYDGTANSLVKSQLRFAILENPISTYDASQRTFAILESGNEANNSSSDGFFAISTRLNGTVAEKFRITSAGNVGIGTTNPVSILDVVGLNGSFPATSSTTQSTGSLVRLRNGNSNLVLDIGGNGGNGNWLQSTNRSDLSVNYPLLLNPNGGNVGIGITNPGYKLDVGVAGSDVISVRLTPGYERVRFNTFDLLGYNDGNLWMIGNNPTNTLVLGKTWDWDNQIGIAYTPGTVGNSGGILQIGQINKNNANYTHGITRLYTNGLERITIIANGNVGIGTTLPTTPLHVVGVISGSSFSGAGTGLTGTAANLTAGTATIANGVSTGAVKSGGLEENSVITSKIADGNVTNVKLANSSVTIGSTAVALGASAITIAGLTSVTSTAFVGALTGNVTGTATTASYANALNVANSYTGVNLTATGFFQTNGGSIKTDTASGLAVLTTADAAQSIRTKGILLGTSYDTNPGANEIRTTNNTSLYLNARGTGDIQFQTADSLKMMLLNNGNIGIGTSNPSALLQIDTPSLNGNGQGLRINRPSAGTHYHSVEFTTNGTVDWSVGQNSNDAFEVYESGAAVTTRFTIKQGGNVGIGTTSPLARLQVNSPTAGATLLRADGTNGTLFSVVDDLSDSLMSVNNSAGLPVLEVFADDRVVMGQYNTNDFVLRNNKVGIGTNNPQFKLDVTGSLGVNASSLDTNWAFVVSDNSSAGSRYSLNKLGSMGFNNADNYAQLQLLGSSGAYVDFTNSVGGDSNARLIYYAGSRLDLTYGFATTITLNSTGVGIGTTLPTTALHVVGVISGSSFSGAGTGLTGTASGLSIGGSAATWTTARTLTIGSTGKSVNGSADVSWSLTELGVGNGTITIAAGTGVGVGTTNTFTTNQSGATTVTISNTGVTSAVAGTGVGVSGATGAVTFSIGQAVGTANSPTFAAVTTSTDGANHIMSGTTNAEGIRMTPASSTTYPVFLRSINPGVGEASPWIYKEQATDWGIWHNNPVNSIDFTKAGSAGIASNVGGSSTNTVTVRVEMATGFVQTIAGYRNSAGTTILDNNGNITGNAATVTTNANLTGDVTSTGNATTIASNAVTTAKIANSNVTLAKIENITAYTILGNSNASAAATPAALSVGTVATMLSGQTMNIAGSSTSCTGNAATATTATTANALNTSNSYTVTNLIASGYLQSTVGYLRTDDSNGIEVLTTTNSAQSINVKGILIGSSYDTTPPQNEIRTSNNQSLNLNARGTGDITLSTADGERVRLLNGGNVGIGTSNPGRKLDVEGIVRTRGASGTGGFEIGAASSGAAKWRIEWDSASDSLDFNWVG